MKKQDFKPIWILAMTTGLWISGLAPSVRAAEKTIYDYTPVDINGHWAAEQMDDFLSSDILTGVKNTRGETELQPDKKVTRAEFVTMLVRALNLSTSGAGKTFSDVNSTDWYAESVRIASDLEIVNGKTSTSFAPNQSISRAEITTLLVRSFQGTIPFTGSPTTFPDVGSHWAKATIAEASKAGLLNGMPDGTFKPDAIATRAEAITFMSRALHKETPNGDAANLQLSIKDFLTGYSEEMYENNRGNLSSHLGKVTGYYQQEMIENFNFYRDLEVLDGVTVEAEFADPSTIETGIIKETKRFVAVEVTGAEVSLTYTEPLGSFEEVVNLDGVYFFKKMPDNSWKLYNCLYYDVQAGEAATKHVR